jgi:hypothetical protein
VDIHSLLDIVRVWWICALGDAIHRLVHGEEKINDRPPLGEVLPGGVDLELHVFCNMDTDNWVGGGVGGNLRGKHDGGGVVAAGTMSSLTERLRRSSG